MHAIDSLSLGPYFVTFVAFKVSYRNLPYINHIYVQDPD